MDGNTVGGIAGTVLGVSGGLVGTYFSIRNTNGPRERAFMIRAGALCWLAVLTLLALDSLLPRLLGSLIFLVYMLSMYPIVRWGNEQQARLRVEDSTRAGISGGQAAGR
jgi:hypothetical protein